MCKAWHIDRQEVLLIHWTHSVMPGVWVCLSSVSILKYLCGAAQQGFTSFSLSFGCIGTSLVVSFCFPCDIVASWLFSSNPDADFEKSPFRSCKVCSIKSITYCSPYMLNSICLDLCWLTSQVWHFWQGKTCWSPQLLLRYICGLPDILERKPATPRSL